jgi:HlyD family secretion protein
MKVTGTRIALVLLAGVAAAGAWWALARRGGGGPAVTYQTTAARRGDLVSQVTATGTLSPVVLVQVGSQVSGTIAELGADYNARVTREQVIARLDPRFFQTAVSQARARVVSARADLVRAQAAAQNARAQHARLKPLVDKGVVPRADLDTSVAEVKSADAQVEVARAAIAQAGAALEQAEVNLAYTTIHAPIDGIVISRNVNVGQTVAASLQSPTLFVIAGDLRRMEVHTSVAESDIGQLHEGMDAEFTVDAFPDRRFAGRVEQVRYEATTVSNVVTYDAVIRVANDSLELRPGMTASVSFILDRRHDVLLVPTRALRYRPQGAPPPERRQAAVWVQRDGSPVAVRVELGLSDGTSSEVISGELAPGDRVITSDSTGAGRAATPQPSAGPRPPRIL